MRKVEVVRMCMKLLHLVSCRGTKAKSKFNSNSFGPQQRSAAVFQVRVRSRAYVRRGCGHVCALYILAE